MGILYLSSLVMLLLVTVMFWLFNRNVRELRLLFTLLLLSTFLWGLFRFLPGATGLDTLISVKMANFWGPLVPSLFLHFAAVYPYNDLRLQTYRNIVRFSYLSAAVASLLVVSPFGVTEVESVDYSINVSEYGLGFLYYALHFILVFSIALYILRRRMEGMKSRTKSTLIQLSIAVLVVFVFNTLFSLIPDLQKVSVTRYDFLYDFPITIFPAIFLLFSITLNLNNENIDLERDSKLKDEFLSIASHQLRTPLTVLHSQTSLLENEQLGKLNKEQKSALKDMRYSTDKMIKMVSEFLDASKMSEGPIDLDIKEINLNEIINNEIASHQDTAKEKSITLHMKTGNKVILNADEHKLGEVISNFIDNAINYSPNKSVVEVELKQLDGDAIFSVKDKGIGVPEEEKEKLFSKFVRASNAKKDRPNGTGLGLYIAKKIIEAHGGDIIFESQKNKGSTFGFKLPIANK